MKPISLQQIRQVVGGKPLTPWPADTVMVEGIYTDTRQKQPGALFVALRGDTHDGHRYLPDAAGGGAVAALVEEPPADRLPNLHLIQVTSTRAAMGKLARAVRQQLGAKVIAVGGSNGKTGTKHLIDSVLSTKLRGSYSPKSFNNDVGVPLAIFPADPNQQYLVLELGTNHVGEISILTNIALPDIAVITCCAEEHLEGLGNLMGVRREEASIIEGLNPEGLLVVNGDDPELLELVAAYRGKRVTFGLKDTNDLFATDIECTLSGTRFRLNGRLDVTIPLLGRHIACNCLAAIAVGRRLGLTEDAIVMALANAHAPEMRLQLQYVNGITVLNDAYNANPASMRAALDTLVRLPASNGRRIAVLGDMRELGEASDRLHMEMGRFVAGLGIDRVLCVGEKAALIAREAQQHGMGADQIARFADTAAAARMIPEWVADGDVVLLKGSRLMRLEKIATSLSSSVGRRVAS